jgi:hypothetical protein
MGKWVLLACVSAACASSPSETGEQYFERDAYPVLAQSCGAGNAAGCHTVSATDPVAQHFDPVFVGLSPDAAYDVLTQEGYTGAFTDDAPLVSLQQHAGGPIDATTLAVIQQWFTIERDDRKY